MLRWCSKLVIELLLIFQSSEFDFETFRRFLTTRKQCFRHVSEEKDGELKSTGFSWEMMQYRALCSAIQPFLTGKIFFQNYKSRYELHQTKNHFPKSIMWQSSTPNFRSFCEVPVVSPSSRTFEREGDGIMEHQSFLEWYWINFVKNWCGACAQTIGHNWYNHEPGAFVMYSIHVVILNFSQLSPVII